MDQKVTNFEDAAKNMKTYFIQYWLPSPQGPIPSARIVAAGRPIKTYEDLQQVARGLADLHKIPPLSQGGGSSVVICNWREMPLNEDTAEPAETTISTLGPATGVTLVSEVEAAACEMLKSHLDDITAPVMKDYAMNVIQDPAYASYLRPGHHPKDPAPLREQVDAFDYDTLPKEEQAKAKLQDVFLMDFAGSIVRYRRPISPEVSDRSVLTADIVEFHQDMFNLASLQAADVYDLFKEENQDTLEQDQ